MVIISILTIIVATVVVLTNPVLYKEDKKND